MDGFDFDTYHHLYQQLLSSGTHPAAGQQVQGAAPFFQPPTPPPQQPQAPMMGQWVGDPAPGYVAAQGYSVLPQPLQQIPGGGIWAGNDARFVPGPSGVAQEQPWAAAAGEDDSMMLGGGDWEGSAEVAQGQAWAAEQAGDSMLGGDTFPGNDQFVDGGGFPSLEDGLDLSNFDYSFLDEPFDWDLMDSMAANQDPSGATNYAPPRVPAAEPNQPDSDSSSPSTQLGAGESPGLTSQMPAYPPVMDYPQAPPEFVHDGGVPSVQGLLMGDFDLSELDDAAANSLWESLAAIQAAAHPSSATAYAPPMVPASDSSSPSTQVGAAESPGLTSQIGAYLPVMEYQQPPHAFVDRPQAVAQMVGVAAESPVADYPQQPPASVDTLQAVPDYENALVAQMVSVALRCDDKVSRDWSEEENQVLREGLSRFAGQDNANKCFSIASGLANKTVMDVAYRIRWLSDLEQKKRVAKQAQLEQEKSARGNVTKGGTKGATRKNNKKNLSKEVLNSKSAKDLLRDNNRLMDKIEEILRTRQVKDSADHFYYVKMTMNALQNKVTNMSSVMEGRWVDDDEWEVVLKDRQPLAGKDTATPP